MANLSFVESLSPEQLQYAKLIGERAKAVGLPPDLAIAIAYQESRLNPKISRGAAGEYGIMQVKPATGKQMGYSVKDLQDPNKNIEAGIRYLKMAYDRIKNDPESQSFDAATIGKLAAAGYNAGIDSQFFKTGELPASTRKYINDLRSYGTFGVSQPAQAEQAPAPAPAPAPAAAPAPAPAPTATAAPGVTEPGKSELVDVPPSAPPSQQIGPADPREKLIAQGIGAGLGAVASLPRVVGDISQERAARRAMGEQLGRQRAFQQMGGLSAAEAAQRVIPSAPQNIADRIALGRTDESGLPGRQRQTGYAEETAQRAARQREAYSAAEQLRRSGVVAEPPGKVFAEYPDVTSSPRGVLYPKGVEFPQTPSAKTAPLERVSQMFEGMMQTPAGQTLGRGLRYAGPIAGGAATLGEIADIKQQYMLPEEKRDVSRIGLSGLSLLGTGLSLFPATAPVGLPLAFGAPALQYMRDRNIPVSPETQEENEELELRRQAAMKAMEGAPMMSDILAP